MMHKQLLGGLLLALLLTILGCANPKPHYIIGVSQCSADIWREKQNAELRMGAYCQENVELRFAAAHDSDERQVQQIDSLVNSGIDLLIVAPNQVQTISPAIDRAYDKGIPVIVFERKTNSQKYTSFISADNYEMGRIMGEYIASRLHGKGRVMEIMGLKGSSPAIERHNGFADALKNYPDITVVATLQGDWTEESAVKAVKAYPGNLDHIDFVFGQNDRMAMGARRVLQESPRNATLSKREQLSQRHTLTERTADSHQPLYCGIDGLPGEDGGIRLVRDSILDASYIYPTHGDKIIELAINILEGKPYEKETLLQSALVTRDNAKVLLMQSEEMMRQAEYLDQLHSRADTYLKELATQHVVNWMSMGVILLLVVTIVLFYLDHLRKVKLQQERVVSTLWNMEIEPAPVADKTKEQTADSSADEKPFVVAESAFLARFREVVEARMEDSEVSVDDLAAEMSLSRVQLYRKIKTITGSSPVELLRTTRLKRAYQMLLTTDKSVSEVAYAVGFTAPSYFSKCFKEEYGMVPGDIRK